MGMPRVVHLYGFLEVSNTAHYVIQPVGNVLNRHGIAPAPKRSQTTTWKEFIQSHLAVMAGMDFFTVEVLTWRGLVTYYILFFIHLESRRVSLAGITRHPDQDGCNRWRATRPARAGDSWISVATYRMIATRSLPAVPGDVNG